MRPPSTPKRLFVITLTAVLIGLGIYVFSQERITQPSTPLPDPGPITISGKMVCLPHKDTSGPQTMECAFGLQDASGIYYGLRDSDPQYGNISGLAGGEPVTIEGVFTPQADDKYQSVGVIEVLLVVPNADE